MKNYKAVVNVKDSDEIIFRAGGIYEGDWDGETLTLWGKGDFMYEYTNEKLIANFIEV